jgi:hypothetical protein
LQSEGRAIRVASSFDCIEAGVVEIRLRARMRLSVGISARTLAADQVGLLEEQVFELGQLLECRHSGISDQFARRYTTGTGCLDAIPSSVIPAIAQPLQAGNPAKCELLVGRACCSVPRS